MSNFKKSGIRSFINDTQFDVNNILADLDKKIDEVES